MTNRQQLVACARVLLSTALPLAEPGLEPTRKRALALCARVERGDEALAGDAVEAVAHVMFAIAESERQGRAA